MNYTERQNIQQGKAKPDLPLSELMALVAVDFAIDFRENVKTFSTVDNTGTEPVSINTDANQYKSQILGLCNQILNFERNKSGGLLNSLTRVFITILGRTNFTYAQIEGATQLQWENFLESKILEIVEHIAGVSKEGKVEYNLIK